MSGGGARTKSECEALAKESGLIAFYPEDDELMLDYDIDFEVATLKKGVAVFRSSPARILQEHAHIDRWTWTKSVSGNAHLYLRLHEKYTYEQRCLMQAILGSDLTREAFNLIRYMNNSKYNEKDPYVIALFETPDQAKLVEEWRATRRN